ncbi:hypothetical protein J3E68DRAFT_387704 [Trichoderma sp. SZMC 28012]
MNACAYCKNGKRKCDKARPSCSNCIRLHRTCIYTEDAIQVNFPTSLSGQRDPAGRSVPIAEDMHAFELPGSRFARSISALGPINQMPLRQPMIDLIVRAEALQILGSLDKMNEIAAQYFVGTHQRMSILSKSRFYRSLHTINAEPKADFLTLCLCMYLIEQIPLHQPMSMQSTLYVIIKSLLGMLEATEQISLDIVQARTLVTCYEIGHGLHTAACISVAACAKTARALGIHKQMRRNSNNGIDGLIAEEEKRTWWAILNMDRFVGLCSGDFLFSTEDPEGLDPLPVEDLLWSQDGDPVDLRASILGAPTLATPPAQSVGQMARECQVSHLAGRVIRHTTNPTSDPNFNAEEAIQLERTLQTILLLLIDEDLTFGRYCGALGICDSALFTLYEFLLGRCDEHGPEKVRILESMQELSERAVMFAEAGYADKETFYLETLSPFLPYCLYQAGIVQYRLWKQKGDPIYKVRLDALSNLLRGNGKRWAVAATYLDVLERLQESWPPIVTPSYLLNFREQASVPSREI